MDMQFVICVPFMKGDIWVERLERLGTEYGLRVYEYTRPEDLAKQPGMFHLDAVWVVMDGAPGMEAIYLIREQHRKVPIVWVSDDVQFGLIGYDLQVFDFLLNDCTDQKLAVTIKRCRENYLRTRGG